MCPIFKVSSFGGRGLRCTVDSRTRFENGIRCPYPPLRKGRSFQAFPTALQGPRPHTAHGGGQSRGLCASMCGLKTLQWPACSVQHAPATLSASARALSRSDPRMVAAHRQGKEVVPSAAGDFTKSLGEGCRQHTSCCDLQASITLPHWDNCHTEEDGRELATIADPATRRIRKLARTHLRTTLAR